MTRMLVTGATGHLGGAALGHLLARTDPADVVAMARDEAKGRCSAGPRYRCPDR